MPTRNLREGAILRLTFLGTASARPTVARNVSSIAVQREGRLFLFDCGEGTQRQMMRFGVGFSVTDIFITHVHADHYLGLTGLVRTMSLQGRVDELAVWGPPGSHDILKALITLGGERLTFATHVRELPAGESLVLGDYRIQAFAADHTREAIGFALIEDARPGRFDVETARRLEVPEGPLFGVLHEGESVQLPDGRVILPGDVVGPSRPGRKVVYTGDTRPSPGTIEIARNADLLVHEATFDEEESVRANDTAHSTARQAAEIAAAAKVRQLILTHLSARYSDQPRRLLAEARQVFPDCLVAKDGLSVEVSFPDGSSSDPPDGTR
jgi:ribonuclease Z